MLRTSVDLLPQLLRVLSPRRLDPLSIRESARSSPARSVSLQQVLSFVRTQEMFMLISDTLRLFFPETAR